MSADFFFADARQPVYVISVAAQLSGLHAQTLRQYDRMGLVVPQRTKGGGRRYSAADIELLRQVQQLSGEGLGLEGIARVLRLEQENAALDEEVDRLRGEVDRLRGELAAARAAAHSRSGAGARVFAAGDNGVVVLPPGRRPRREAGPSSSLVLWRPPRPLHRS